MGGGRRHAPARRGRAGSATCAARVARRANPRSPGPRRRADAQMRVMQTALARVQEHHTTWIRADLMREIADSMPPEAHAMAPAESVALVRAADRPRAGRRGRAGHVAGRAGVPAGAGVPPPGAGRPQRVHAARDTTRYATSVQIAREKELLDATAKEGAPHLTRETVGVAARRGGRGARGGSPGEGHEPTRQLVQRRDPGPGCRPARSR